MCWSARSLCPVRVPGQARTGPHVPVHERNEPDTMMLDGIADTKELELTQVGAADGQMRETFDCIVSDLRQLRVSAGAVSYAELVRRIAKHRTSSGINPEASHPARSTVYDAFKYGRTRINSELIGEIVRALGEDERNVEQWRQRCYSAKIASEGQSPTQSNIVESDPAEPTSPLTAPEPSTLPRRSLHFTLGVLAFCFALNFTGHVLVGTLHLSLYLDMLGTAIASILLGPWHGVAVALIGNGAGFAVHGATALPFGLVNMVGALVWGYGVRRWSLGTSVPRFFVLNLLVAVACTLVATPLLVFGFSGGTGHAAEGITRTFESFGEPLMLAVLQANLFTSITDKLLTGFAAIAAVSVIRGWETHTKPDDDGMEFSTVLRMSVFSPVALLFPHTIRMGMSTLQRCCLARSLSSVTNCSPLSRI